MLENQRLAATGLYNKPLFDPRSPESVENSLISGNTSQDGLPISDSEDEHTAEEMQKSEIKRQHNN
jgi:hypothetical protein